jgi:hypothetical protein
MVLVPVHRLAMEVRGEMFSMVVLAGKMTHFGEKCFSWERLGTIGVNLN